MSTRFELEENIEKAHEALDLAEAVVTEAKAALAKANVAQTRAVQELLKAYADRERYWENQLDS